MAFKRSGVRLPLAPPISLLILNSYFIIVSVRCYNKRFGEAPGKHERPNWPSTSKTRHGDSRTEQYNKNLSLQPHVAALWFPRSRLLGHEDAKPQSSSASRITAALAGFLLFSQLRDRPER